MTLLNEAETDVNPQKDKKKSNISTYSTPFDDRALEFHTCSFITLTPQQLIEDSLYLKQGQNITKL